MSEWTKEQLEEMFGDDVVQQLAFIAGCTKHSYSDPKNAELNGFIISHDSLYKFAELIVRECANWVDNATVTDSAGNKDFIGDSYFWATEMKKHFGVKE